MRHEGFSKKKKRFITSLSLRAQLLIDREWNKIALSTLLLFTHCFFCSLSYSLLFFFPIAVERKEKIRGEGEEKKMSWYNSPLSSSTVVDSRLKHVVGFRFQGRSLSLSSSTTSIEFFLYVCSLPHQTNILLAFTGEEEEGGLRWGGSPNTAQ